MMSKPVVECSTEQTVNTFIVELVKLGNEYSKQYPNSNYIIARKGSTKEEIRQNLENAFADQKEKMERVKTKMLISDILEQLDSLKKEYNRIASNYHPIGYEDCDVNFGSIMWMDAYPQDKEQSNPHDRTEEQINADYKRVRKIIEEADAIFEKHQLHQFLLEQTTAYWLGVYAEPYTSVY